ncbi:MAG: DUF1552 domain-containing protein [Myxococcota bacterium]
MIVDHLSRRMFLRGATGVVLVPFLPSLVRAQAMPAKLKYMQMVSTYGTQPERALAPERFSPTQSLDADTTVMSLREIVEENGRISELYGTDWNELVDNINVVTNFHGYFDRNLHHATGVTTGGGVVVDRTTEAAFPYSVDWVLENEIYGNARPAFRAIRATLGDGSSHYANSHSFGGERRALDCDRNYSQLAAKLTSNNPSQRSMQADVLNGVYEDYRAITMDSRLSSLDRERLEAHVAHVADARRRALTSGLCEIEGALSPPDNGTMHRNALELLTGALACGSTQIATYVILQGGDSIDDPQTLHGAHHNRAAEAGRHAVWRSSLAAHAVRSLRDRVDETGESLLSSTVFYFGQEYADSAGNAHSLVNYTAVIAGGAGGRLTSGQYVDAGGAPIGRLLVTLFNAMGLDAARYERGGTVGFGEYSRERLRDVISDASFAHFTSTAERRRPLPIFRG